jgi:cell division GTPase FtsZ
MKDKGTALMGIGAASGPNRALEAARHAIHSSLLEVTIDGATDAIVNITGSEKLSLQEVDVAIAEIRNNCGKDLNIIYGAAINNDLGDEIVITVVATGYELKAKNSGYDELRDNIYRNMSNDNITYDALEQYHNSVSNDNDDYEDETSGSIEDIFGVKRSRREEKLRQKEEKKKKTIEKKQEPQPQARTGMPDWLTRK